MTIFFSAYFLISIIIGWFTVFLEMSTAQMCAWILLWPIMLIGYAVRGIKETFFAILIATLFIGCAKSGAQSSYHAEEIPVSNSGYKCFVIKSETDVVGGSCVQE